MHIYKMNDYDFVVSKLDKEKTNKWYEKEVGEKNALNEIIELDIDKDGLFYEVAFEKVKNKRIYPPNEAKIFGRFTTYLAGEVCEYISFREALNREGNKETPYVIASTLE